MRCTCAFQTKRSNQPSIYVVGFHLIALSTNFRSPGSNSAPCLARYGFSRAAIPWPRDFFASNSGQNLPDSDNWFRHIGIYAYRVAFLHQYVDWTPAPLELLEQLEQLRALHNGVRIHVAQAMSPVPAGVDTQEDLDVVRSSLAEGSPET